MTNHQLCTLVLFALFSFCFSACNFDCNGEKTFHSQGVNFTCPGDNKVCNKFNAYNDCRTCITDSLKCRNQFRCLSSRPDEVIIGGTQVKCPDQYKCNMKGVGDCPPCIHKGCNTPLFQCSDEDEELVVIMNMQSMCANGTVCNKNNLPPCYPCVERSASVRGRLEAYQLL